MEFHEGMIGKRVKDTSTGDLGEVLSDCEYAPGEAIWVRWDDSGCRAWIHLSDVTFQEGEFQVECAEEITINGKRYKLIPIE